MFVRYWGGGARSIECEGWGEGRRSRLTERRLLLLDDDGSHGSRLDGTKYSTYEQAIFSRRQESLNSPCFLEDMGKCSDAWSDGGSMMQIKSAARRQVATAVQEQQSRIWTALNVGITGLG